MTHQRIRLGISACLLGEAVPFDGGHKRDPFLVESLGQFVDWVPLCPEVESGLDAPRESMRLVQSALCQAAILLDAVGEPGFDRCRTCDNCCGTATRAEAAAQEQRDCRMRQGSWAHWVRAPLDRIGSCYSLE